MQRAVRSIRQVEGVAAPTSIVRAAKGAAELLGWNIVFASAYVVYSTFVSALDPVSALAWMSAFATVAAFAVGRCSPGELAKLRRANRMLLVVQTLSTAVAFVILFALLSREHAVSVLTLLLVIPVMNVLTAAVIFGDRASWAWWFIGFLLCLTGSVVFRFSGDSAGQAAAVAIALAAAYVLLSVSSSITRSALTRAGVSAAGITLVAYAATCLLAFASAWATGRLALPSLAQLLALAYLGVIPTAAGAIGFQSALDRVGYPTAEAIGMTKPFLGYAFTLALAWVGGCAPPQALAGAQFAGLCVAAIGAAVCVTLGRPTRGKQAI